jgi:hypothetical protein
MSSSIMYHDLIAYSDHSGFCNVQYPAIATDHLKLGYQLSWCLVFGVKEFWSQLDRNYHALAK